MSDDKPPLGARPLRGSDPIADALESVSRQDSEAFEEVYRRTSARLFGVCRRIVPSRQEAEEVLQEVYLTVWRRASSYDRVRGPALAWLVTLARNHAIDRLRMRGSAASLIGEADFADPEPMPDELLQAGEDVRRLRECLDTLASADTSLIQAAFFQGSTYSELAERTDTPLGTIKSRVRRALLKLKNCLQ